MTACFRLSAAICLLSVPCFLHSSGRKQIIQKEAEREPMVGRRRRPGIGDISRRNRHVWRKDWIDVGPAGVHRSVHHVLPPKILESPRLLIDTAYEYMLQENTRSKLQGLMHPVDRTVFHWICPRSPVSKAFEAFTRNPLIRASSHVKQSSLRNLSLTTRDSFAILKA